MSAVFLYKDKKNEIIASDDELEINSHFEEDGKLKAKRNRADFREIKKGDKIIIYNDLTYEFLTAEALDNYCSENNSGFIKITNINRCKYNDDEITKIIEYFKEDLRGFTFKKIADNVANLRTLSNDNKFENSGLAKLAKIILNNYYLILSYKDYLGKIEDFGKKSNSKIIYRGQTEEWNLVPSLFRQNYEIEVEKKLYKNIRKYNLNELGKKDNFIDELVKMQHYGIPTPLLDWSENPMTALFFSVSGNTDKDGYVIVSEPDDIFDFNEKEYEDLSKILDSIYSRDVEIDKVLDKLNNKKFINDLISQEKNNFFFINPIYGNDRIRSQAGLFSLSLLINQYDFNQIKETLVENMLKKQESNIKNKLKSGYEKELIDKYIEIFFQYTNAIFKLFFDKEDQFISELSRIYDNKNYNDLKDRIKFGFKSKDRGNNINEDLFKSILTIIHTAAFDFNEKIKNKIMFNDDSNSKAGKTTEVIPEKKIEFLILNEFKEEIREVLNELFNINSTNVYPDLEGYVKYIKGQFSSSGGVKFD